MTAAATSRLILLCTAGQSVDRCRLGIRCQTYELRQQRTGKSWRFAVLNVAIWSVAGIFFCLTGCTNVAPAEPPPVTILTAASTGEAVTQVAEEFQRETGLRVRVSIGPSNALARQVLNGAPADLFLSASVEWGEAVRSGGRAAAIEPLLTNRLVLIVPAGNPAAVMQPSDLLKRRVRRVALAGEEVPAGRYAEAALRGLGLLQPLSDKIGGKIARGHDVRSTLAFVERGEADAGIVYATDAALSGRVTVVATLESDPAAPIVYPLVLLTEGPAGAAGGRFFRYLASPAATAVFRRYGFAPVQPAARQAAL